MTKCFRCRVGRAVTGRASKGGLCRACHAELAAAEHRWCNQGRHALPLAAFQGKAHTCRACERVRQARKRAERRAERRAAQQAANPERIHRAASVTELAAVLGVSRPTIYDWQRRGILEVRNGVPVIIGPLPKIGRPRKERNNG